MGTLIMSWQWDEHESDLAVYSVPAPVQIVAGITVLELLDVPST